MNDHCIMPNDTSDGQTNFATTLDPSLPNSGGRPYCGAMVEWHDGLSWLRDDDADDITTKENSHINKYGLTCWLMDWGPDLKTILRFVLRISQDWSQICCNLIQL